MKKILSFILALVMLLGICATANAAEEYTELEQKFYDYCVSALPENEQPSEGDKVIIPFTMELNGATYFYGSCDWLVGASYRPVDTFGDDVLRSNSPGGPYELNVYMYNGDEIYTLEEAYNAEYITDVTLLKPEFSGWITFAKKHISNPENKYEDAVFEIMGIYDYPDEEWWEPPYYDEGRGYFGPDNTTTGDEAVPDYVLISMQSNVQLPMSVAHVVGDYVLFAESRLSPFTYGYGIYVPSRQIVCDLEEAPGLGVENINAVFENSSFGELIGDMDRDRTITIKDATEIQKCLAGLSDNINFNNPPYWEHMPIVSIADFSRDREVNIKDATAIQKHIAGLEY